MRYLVSTVRVASAAILSSGLLFVSPLLAETVNSTGSVLLISDYLYRGISQTDEGPALQGSLTLATDSGWYASAWGSNIKFGQGSMELDISAGRSFAVAPDWTVDLGLMQYRYPKGDNSTDQFNFIEGYGKLINTQVTSRYEFQSRWALAMQGSLAKQCRLPCETG